MWTQPPVIIAVDVLTRTSQFLSDMNDRDKKSKRYDVSVKLITEADPRSLARFATGQQIEVVEVLEREMPATELRADTLMRIADGAREYLLVVEFQTRPQSGMPLRLLHYWAAANRKHDLPVRVVVIYLTGKRSRLAQGPPRTSSFPPDRPSCSM